MKRIIVCVLACLLLACAAGCAAEQGAGQVLSATLTTIVDGDGQKPWTLLLDYGEELAAEAVSEQDYAVEGYEIAAVYVTDERTAPCQSASGRYVCIELSLDYTNPGYTTLRDGESGIGGEDRGERPADAGNPLQRPGSENGMGGGMPTGGMSAGGMEIVSVLSNQLSVTWKQVSGITAVDGTVFEANQTGTTVYTENENLLVDDFSQLVFTCADGTELMVNIYVPVCADGSELLPLMLFMPDATGEGNDPVLTLTESKGAVIFASEESQQEHPCIVLAPQYVSANSSNPEYTIELLQAIMEAYPVDQNRVYLSGQSSGTIRAIKMMIDHPDLFAAAMLVAGQADAAYEDRLAELSGQSIWMLCSAGDQRAYPGMTAIQEAVSAAGTQVIQGEWSARLPIEEQNRLSSEMISDDCSFYWTVFDAGTVMREDTPVSAVTEHMNTWRVAFDVESIRGWVFDQTKE